MKLIMRGRGRGKTYHILKESYVTQTPILCLTEHNMTHLKEQAKRFDFKIPEPLLYTPEFKGNMPKVAKIRGVLLDNADDFLRAIVGTNIPTVSLSTCDLDIESLNESQHPFLPLKEEE